MTPELQLRSEIDEYIRRRQNNGDLLEDITDDLQSIVEDKISDWFLNNPISRG